MSSPPEDPRVTEIIEDTLDQQIPDLAIVYDRWAHSINPDAEGIDEAERTFHQSVSQMFDALRQANLKDFQSVTLRDFRRHVITRCKKHLSATSKPPSV